MNSEHLKNFIHLRSDFPTHLRVLKISFVTCVVHDSTNDIQMSLKCQTAHNTKVRPNMLPSKRQRVHILYSFMIKFINLKKYLLQLTKGSPTTACCKNNDCLHEPNE